MGDKTYDGFFLSSSPEIPQINEILEENTINYYSVPPMSDDQLRLWLHAPFVSNFSMEDHLQLQDHHHQSSFEISSSRKMIPKPCLDDIISNQSGEEKRTHVEIQTKEKDEREKAKEDVEREDANDCKQRKRKRSNEVQNLNERLRRQKLAKKMKALQDVIPSSSKRDQASTIDEAIKYIRTLQYQLQMKSMGAGYSMFHSPPLMMPHQGIQIPSPTPFLQAIGGMNYGIETGMFSPFNFPTPQLGLPNPCLFPPSAANSIQNGGNFLGSYATGFPCFGSQSNKQGETS